MSDDAAPPQALRPLADFVRTWDAQTGEDAIDTPDALAAWLHGCGLLDAAAPVTAEDLRTAAAVRAALAAALSAHHGSGQTPAEGSADETALAGLPLRLTFDEDGTASLRPHGTGVPAALAALVAPIPAAQADGTWQRLKLCPESTCAVPFYDHSRNRSRRWCAMEVCGNRTKSRRHRERRREDA